jgi:hypothetical protein
VQLYQIDRRLDLMMNLQLASLIPVIDPTNRRRKRFNQSAALVRRAPRADGNAGRSATLSAGLGWRPHSRRARRRRSRQRASDTGQTAQKKPSRSGRLMMAGWT